MEMEGRKHRAIKRKVERVRWLNENKGLKTSNTLPATMQLNMLGQLPRRNPGRGSLQWFLGTSPGSAPGPTISC